MDDSAARTAQVNTTPPNPSDDEGLRRILREAHPKVELPPGFQRSVWRRIEAAGRESAPGGSWLESLVAKLLRPAFAMTAIAVLAVAGAGLGTRTAQSDLNEQARARYVSSVSPFHRAPPP